MPLWASAGFFGLIKVSRLKLLKDVMVGAIKKPHSQPIGGGGGGGGGGRGRGGGLPEAP